MKKIITLLLMFTAFAGVSNAQVDDGWTKNVHWTFKGLRVDSIKSEDNHNQRQVYTYDNVGRFIKLYQLSNDEEYDYDGSIVKVLDEYLNERNYNEAGQVVSDTRKFKAVSEDTWETLSSIIYGYKDDGRLDSMVDFESEKDIYTYDDANNKMTITHYDTDYNGNMPKASVVDYMYDANHVLTAKDSCDVSGTEPVYYHINYVYDNNGLLIEDTTFIKKNDAWEYTKRSEYINGDFGSLTKITYNYTDGAWLTYQCKVTALDEHHNYTEISAYTCDDSGSSITSQTFYKDNYTYNDEGNPLTAEIHSYLAFFDMVCYDTYERSEQTYEDGKVIQKNYKKYSADEEWAYTSTMTYYVTKLNDYTGIESIQNANETSDIKKTFVNGKLVIMNNGKTYNAAGQRMK